MLPQTTTPTTTVGMVFNHPATTIHTGPPVVALVAMCIGGGMTGAALFAALYYPWWKLTLAEKTLRNRFTSRRE